MGYHNCYEVPEGMQPNSAESNKYLAGEEFFTVEELELYKIIIWTIIYKFYLSNFNIKKQFKK